MTDSASQSPAQESVSCRSSLESGEFMFASASHVDTWFVLEYNATWGAKALPESPLPETLKKHINQQAASVPNGRFQFIKQVDKREGIRLYVAQSGEQPALYQLDLNSYDDLLSVELAAILAGKQGQKIDETLFLVCTNGKRDLCCARHGLPVYRAMRQYAGHAVWETIHLGGHRFAGTLVCLPHGLYYGRVHPEQGKAIIDSYREGNLILDIYRGWSAWDAPVQAADYFLREQTGLRGINDVRLTSSEPSGENRWTVRLATTGGQTYKVEVYSEKSEFTVYETSKDTTPNHVTQFRLASCEPA